MDFVHAKGVILPSNERKFQSYLNKKGEYQKIQMNLALLCDSSERTCAIDVGAHVGLISRFLAEKYKTVLAFEPSDINRACFNQNVTNFNNIVLFPYALGNQDDERELLMHPDNSGGNSLIKRYCMEAKERKKVRVRTLDSIIGKNYNFGNIDLIKIDVQGGEESVLQGAVDTIDAHKPVIIYEGETKGDLHDEEGAKLLEELGYVRVAKIKKERILAHKDKITKLGMINAKNYIGAVEKAMKNKYE